MSADDKAKVRRFYVVMRISDIVRFENGKVVERSGVEDMSGFMS